jgi:diguanylate cyclase (GGDEF)-like protein/PAS domain S-box-containing protein
MTSQAHDHQVVPVRPSRSHPVSRRERALLARKWAYQVTTTTYIPLSYPDIEAELLALVDRLFDAVRGEPFSPDPATEVAHRLVAMNCVGPTTFRRTMDLLGKALLGHAELRGMPSLPDKIVALLGTLSASYVEAVRQLTLQQQDDLNRTLIVLGRDSRVALRATQTRLDAFFANTAVGIGVTEVDGRFLDTNAALTDILGYPQGDLTQRTLFDLIPQADEPFVRDACAGLLEGFLPRLRQRRRLVARSGDEVPVTLTVSMLREPDQPDRFLVLVQDDSELNLLQRQLTLQTLHDVVTGLPNRQFFSTRLETALHKADPDSGVTVYHLGLDAFALVSDGLGRPAGDQVLKAVAERLKAAVTEEKAVVARLDSDEFAILIENSPTTPDVSSMVDRINRRMAEPVSVDGRGVTVSTSIGVVHRPCRDLEPTELLRASDLALRRAKARGRRQWELFDARQDADDRAEFTLAITMGSAWEAGEVQLSWRAQVELGGEALAGVEAGLRWAHPRLGQLDHGRCVELAEQTGLMPSLGDWLLHSACTRVQGWRPDVPLLLWLTDGQSVDPDLVGRVLGILDATDVKPDRLRLGVPVHLLHGDRPEPVENLRVLADAGVAMVLDGFGAAGDLGCLEELPTTAVRISSRMRTGRTPLQQGALAGMIAVIHQTGATVMVDGIDTPAVADRWRDAGADMALGSHFPFDGP